eukprot:1234171-Pleurochrysis_carterae.AAC.1
MHRSRSFVRSAFLRVRASHALIFWSQEASSNAARSHSGRHTKHRREHTAARSTRKQRAHAGHLQQSRAELLMLECATPHAALPAHWRKHTRISSQRAHKSVHVQARSVV